MFAIQLTTLTKHQPRYVLRGLTQGIAHYPTLIEATSMANKCPVSYGAVVVPFPTELAVEMPIPYTLTERD